MPVLVALVIGVVTGNVADTLAKGSKALKVVAVVIRAHDAAGNAVNVGRGVGDIRQNGLTVGNVLQVGAGGLAIAGDLGEVSEAAFKKLKIGAGELWVDELGAMGLPGDISTVRAAQRQADQVVAPKTKPKPFSDPRIRPKYAEGQVEKVWENAKQADGKVYDPNTGAELTWDPTEPTRTGIIVLTSRLSCKANKDRHHRIDFPAELQYNHRIAPSCSGVFL